MFKAISKENLFEKDCIRTVSGIYVNVVNPTTDMICIEDIAHALSRIPRFGGHLKEYYTVAQHSVMCAMASTPEHQYAALMHDASEAYLLDIPSPLKLHLPEYKVIEDNMMRVIAQALGVVFPFAKEIKQVDSVMLEKEWGRLVLNDGIDDFEVWNMEKSKSNFLEYYNLLKS